MGIADALKRCGLGVLKLRFGDGSAFDLLRREVLHQVLGWTSSGAVVCMWVAPLCFTLSAAPALLSFAPQGPCGVFLRLTRAVDP